VFEFEHIMSVFEHATVEKSKDFNLQLSANRSNKYWFIALDLIHKGELCVVRIKNMSQC